MIKCEDCGEVYDEDDVIFEEHEGQMICEYCFADDRYDSEERALSKAEDQYNEARMEEIREAQITWRIRQ
jgi:hypothetical protein